MGNEYVGSASFSADLRNVRVGARIVAECADAMELPSEKRHALDLSVSEALANAIKHSSAIGDDGISLKIDAKRDKIVVEVTDNGPGFDFDSVQIPDFPTSKADAKPSGYGIYLIKELADEISYVRQDGRNVLTLVLGLLEE